MNGKTKFPIITVMIFCLYMGNSFAMSEKEIDEGKKELPKKIFNDVKIESPNYLIIKYLKENDLIHGYSDGNFKPNQIINRAEAMKILTKAIKFEQFSFVEKPIANLNNEKENKNCDFPDVKKEDWFYEYICEAYNNNVVHGYPDNFFRPEKSINKVESIKVAVLQSGMKIEKNFSDNFSDVESSQWFAPYTALAKSNFFILEKNDGTLKPNDSMTREEFSGLIYRLIKNRTTKSQFGKASYYASSLDGRGTASGEVFSTKAFTAAHRTLPFNSMIKVINLENGKEVTVKINDRGPFIKGGIIDLSPAAFEKLAPLSKGVIQVEIISEE